MALLAGAPATAQVATEVRSQVRRAVVRLEISGIGSDGMKESKVGTGFLVTEDGYVLTAEHNVLYKNSEAYSSDRKIVAFVNIAQGLPLEAQLISTDASLGVAILKLPEETELRYQPVPLCMDAEPKANDGLVAFGFPEGQQFAARDGPLDSKDGVGARWQTGIFAMPGMSGGPVTDIQGRVVAIMESGSTQGGPRSTVTPIRWATRLLSLAQPLWVSCAQTATVSSSTDVISVSASVDLINDDHLGMSARSRMFRQIITPTPGYRIVSTAVTATSANNNSEPSVALQPDGSAEFRVNLTSGPVFDRWRGWWKGVVVTRQRRISP
ncbi:MULTISPECIES: S1 family peptidase [Sphingobium]|uniref:Serine protease n=2 Tax=Sphingobium yanoikuyae TaxID=13690 RepID=K9D2C9_SPHYA|nr:MULTISPECIES: serine protease [Sphingobium]EKU73162.1 hypothetical protein HMPREF9718_04525 [Sphingobium yanoikuyae ATCC 51230]WQE08802.1 serine protease [Sphingobium yanoikuyae]SHL44733.1 Trypsin-like peptidase domain-containing protein [Sphingobium sp. YR657]